MNDQLTAEALIGDDAAKFLESELGKVMLGMAHQDLEQAVIALDEVDVSDTKKVGQLQLEIRLARRFESYLTELIQRGKEALDALTPEIE